MINGGPVVRGETFEDAMIAVIPALRPRGPVTFVVADRRKSQPGNS
jgi:hypothetical protein